MLKTKSFDLMDDAGINELLSVYSLAEGASIFVSDGKICIPYEDGLPENTLQRNIKINTEINKLSRQNDVIDHAQRVMDSIIADLEAKLTTAEADLASNVTNKKFEARVKELKDAIEYSQSQVRQNVASIEKNNLEIRLYREELV
jgi:hypothetical protein